MDLVIQDMNFRREAMSGEEGVQLFHEIRKRHEDVPMILLTAWTNLETAVELVKAGAADYLAKPWDDSRLLTTVRNLLDLRRARAESTQIQSQRRQARQALAERFDLRGAIYESESMHTLVAMATQVAHADVPVLITGPNGAGKEVLADIIQANSTVRSGAYLKVNLGALPQELIEAELFGTEAGAFTGARARVGRFEAANGGTLFLDELGNLAPAGQAKLLRVLQTGELERLGSNVTRRTQVRMIAATNTDLRAAIREGRFREDLYYRLNVIELELPPLSRRREDILPLARHFLGGERELAPQAERALTRHSCRERTGAAERHPTGLLALRHSDDRGGRAGPSSPEPADLTGEPVVDRASIEHALQRADGVVAHAARDLGLSRQALYRRMEKLGIKSD